MDDHYIFGICRLDGESCWRFQIVSPDGKEWQSPYSFSSQRECKIAFERWCARLQAAEPDTEWQTIQ